MTLNQKLLSTCEEAARAGGRVLLDWRSRFKVREKGPADLVTEADLASQEAIRELIAARFPQHSFLGEETPGAMDIVRSNAAEWLWVVDPLDGTTNYVHGLPRYAVSIAVLHQGATVAGCVFDPIAQECYTAFRGSGARLNGRSLQPSGETDLAKSLVAVSLGAKIDRESPEIADFFRVVTHCQAFRRMGSAALNLCFVAAGTLDAYWSTSTKIWDIAAGALIVEEAGAVIQSNRGGPLDLRQAHFVAAATRPLADEIIGRLASDPR